MRVPPRENLLEIFKKIRYRFWDEDLDDFLEEEYQLRRTA